jgi:HEAT repeat protein
MTPHTQITETLCQMLDTGDEADRCYAARTLGVLAAEDAVDSLIRRLQDEDIDVCVDAAEALGKIASPSALPALLEALANETSGEVSRFITQAIGRIGGEGTMDALIRMATERPDAMEWDNDWDTWWDVQLEAIKGLGNLGADEAVDTLVAIMDDDTHQSLESDILRALSGIPGKGIETLINRMQDSNLTAHSRSRAARALGYHHNEDAIRALGRALKDRTPEVRAAAIGSLANLKADRYFRALILMLRDPSEEVRHAAVKAVLDISRHGTSGEDIQEELKSMLDDPDSHVKTTLFNALTPMVWHHPLTEENLEVVLGGLNDKSAETASAACTLLGHNGDTRALPPLTEVLQNRSGHPMVRREAALAIGRIGTLAPEVMTCLTQAVGDRQQAVRLGALSALMELERRRDPGREDESVQLPLDVIRAAVDGKIELAPEKTQIIDRLQENAVAEATDSAATVVEFDPEITSAPPAGSVAKEGTEPLPDEFSDYIVPPEPQQMPLPDKAGPIVREGEVQQAVSTLDAIAMDNVEMMLTPAEAEEETPLDPETQEYLEVVENNKEMMKRIRNQRNITPEQDVRRLAARTLAESDRPEAIHTLIQALNDEDGLLRREAADAIGEIGRRNPAVPELMDAVGTLITQLAVGDMEQRITCARALGNLGNRTAIPPLMESLKDDNENVRIQAVGALAQLVTEGADPTAADHMVVDDVPPLNVARKLLGLMDDSVMAVRVATARALSRILPRIEENNFREQTTDKIIGSVSQWSGEEARPLGKILRALDSQSCTSKLLAELNRAEDSVKRSVYIEMIEELYTPDQDQPEQAA